MKNRNKRNARRAIPAANLKKIKKCPYCHGSNFVKCGFRIKKLEKVQVYLCKHCQKKFTPLITRGKTYPVAVILRSLLYHCRFLEPKEIAQKIKLNYGLKVLPETISQWVKDYNRYIPFERMRGYLKEKITQGDLKPKDIFQEQKLYHQQIYDFGFHRAKADILLREDFKNYKLKSLKEFLELVAAECPHQVFKKSEERSSRSKRVFDLDQVRIVRKENRACEVAKFVMQAVSNNKERHERLEEFMLFGDSTTVAVEVPVLLDKDDVFHFQNFLNFKVPLELAEDKVITGHIDVVQIRNGAIHIMDFKPSARRYKPIEQLTIYALALSRLTSLRLFQFKCAWFDEDDYFEFFPLHVVLKKKKRKKKSAK